MGISTIVAGIDIGYGNLKIVGGDAFRGEPREVVLPAGAAPADAMPRLHDRPDLKGGELVLLDGAEWVAGVEQIHIQNSVRKTHEAYSAEPEYRALFLAGLARLGYDHIQIAVTGLPVAQFYGTKADDLKAGLVRLMQGRKHVSAHLSVTIDKVVVVPQPFGTFMALASTAEYADLAEREDQCVLVVDVGFGTVDSVALVGQSVLHKYSGSNMLACSHVLEEAAKRIAQETGAKVDSDRLDMVLRRGYDQLTLGQHQVDYRAVLTQVGRVEGDKVAADILKTMRNSRRDVDHIVLTGGGAWLYAPSLEKAFPHSRVVLTPDPVLANAQGYYASARRAALKNVGGVRAAGMAAA